MTNIHSYTKREATKIGFSRSEISDSAFFEAKTETYLFKMVRVNESTVTGHRINKNGSVNKRCNPRAFYFNLISVLYIEPTDVPEEAPEAFEFEGEQYPIRTEEGVKNLCDAFLMRYYGTPLKHPLKISSRMKTCLGYVEHIEGTRTPSKVVFASRLLEHGHITVIADTIFHEMNHYGLMTRTKLPFHDGAKEFEKVCQDIGGAMSVHMVGIKEHYHCERCNFGYGTNSKASYKCPDCSSTLFYMGHKSIFDGTGDFKRYE